MGSIVGRVCGVGLMVLALSGCAAAGGASGAGATAGAIEVAVSETCEAGSTPECVAVNGEHVLIDESAFQRVEVESVTAASDGPGNIADVTLTSDGAPVLEAVTAEVAGAGDDARLVMRAGDDVLSAPAVAEPLTGEHLQISLGDDLTVEEFIQRIART